MYKQQKGKKIVKTTTIPNEQNVMIDYPYLINKKKDENHFSVKEHKKFIEIKKNSTQFVIN